MHTSFSVSLYIYRFHKILNLSKSLAEEPPPPQMYYVCGTIGYRTDHICVIFFIFYIIIFCIEM